MRPHQFSKHTPAQVLNECHKAGASGIFIIGGHAQARMEERNIRRGDLRNALSGALTAVFQPDNGRWRISGGTDKDGDPLDVAIVMENGIVVITVF